MLRIEKIKKTFFHGTVNEKIALDNFSLELKKGDFCTIIGGNGAGKSTLLNSVAGIFSVDKGKIYIDDEEVTKLSEHKRARYIGRVFQDPMKGTASGMMVEENLVLAEKRGEKLRMRWAFNDESEIRYKEMLKRLDLGLEDRLKSRMGLLSGGQRQAVTLLMATLKNPKLLLLDEPTAALDPKTAAKVLGLINEIVKENNLTTIMITHNMRDALKLGNRLIMMDGGRPVYDVAGEEKKHLTIPQLLQKFEEKTHELSDRIFLS